MEDPNDGDDDDDDDDDDDGDDDDDDGDDDDSDDDGDCDDDDEKGEDYTSFKHSRNISYVTRLSTRRLTDLIFEGNKRSYGSDVRWKAIPRMCPTVGETVSQNSNRAWAEVICFQYLNSLC